MNKLIVIQTRFTLINKHIDKNAWRIGREGDASATIRLLLDEERLKTRASIFFNHTLPAIDRAFKTGHNIIHTVLHYSGLPLWLLNLIEAARSEYKWFQPYSFGYEDDCNNYEIIRNEVKSWAKNNKLITNFSFAGVRLDDDDVLGSLYFDKLSRYINSEFAGFAVSFPKGVAALWENNSFIKFSDFYEVKHAQGIAQINIFDVENEKIRCPHYLVPGSHPTVDLRVPTILDSVGPPTYIRAFHASNDIFIARPDLEREYINRIFKTTIDFNGLDNLTF